MKGILLMFLIVVVIIGVIYTVRNSDGETIVDQKRHAVNEARGMLMQTKVVRIREALNTYFMDNGAYPEMLDLLVPDYIRTKQEITDPWGMAIRIERDDTLTTVIHSAGPDTQWDTDDDIWREI